MPWVAQAQLDRKILRLLVSDSRAALSDIGASVGLSTTALHHRIKRLKKNKVIKRFTIALSEEFYEAQIGCFVKVFKFKKSSIELSQKLKAIYEVESCWSVAGEESLLLKIRTKSTKELQAVLEVIGKIEGIERTVTSLIVEEHFNKGAVIL